MLKKILNHLPLFLVLLYGSTVAFAINEKPSEETNKVPFDYKTVVFNGSYIKEILNNTKFIPEKREDAYFFFMTDTDGDTVLDDVDLDDDNDGILDEIENTCSLVSGYDAYWPFDNAADDTSGNGHNLQGTAPTLTYATENKGGTNSFEFDGTKLLQYSDGTFLNQEITNFTYSFWIYPHTITGEQTLVDEGASTKGFAIRLNENTLECAVRSGGITYSTTTFTIGAINTWYHIAAVYESGDLTLYLNGVASTTLST